MLLFLSLTDFFKVTQLYLVFTELTIITYREVTVTKFAPLVPLQLLSCSLDVQDPLESLGLELV